MLNCKTFQDHVHTYACYDKDELYLLDNNTVLQFLCTLLFPGNKRLQVKLNVNGLYNHGNEYRHHGIFIHLF